MIRTQPAVDPPIPAQLAPAQLAPPVAPQSAAERRLLVAALEARASWPGAAAALLADLGYRLLGPGAADESHLLVALRAEPTYRHFDPEVVTYFASSGRIAAMTSLDRAAVTRRGCGDGRVLWGHVHVLDRLPVENRFLTFGGTLRTSQVDSGLTVVDVWSPAPIVRWGGHSQPTDALAEAMGAFFGRLIVPVDFVPGAADRINGLSPEVLYRAFLIDAIGREAPTDVRDDVSSLRAWLAAAWDRADNDQPACEAAAGTLRELGLGTSAKVPSGTSKRA